MAASSPALEILVRGSEGFSIWNGPPFAGNQPTAGKLDKVACSSTKFSEDGSKLLVLKSETVSIYECRDFSEPCGTFLQIFQKYSTPQEKNVGLWKVANGDLVNSQFQKNMTKLSWPAIRFSSDETVACRMATSEIQFFYAKDFSKGATYRLRVPGVTAIEL